jgi:hypothetical protein
MKLKELYKKPISRNVNPAVSATKFDPETQETEIREYVFTDEIIKGLYRILDAIKNNKVYDHVGIWIDGYYGSGKSHFLKYLDYCIKPDTQNEALERLLDAVKHIDPFDGNHDLGSCDYEKLRSIANWLKTATIDTCIFNLETSYDNSTDKKKAFLHVFWNEFNAKRGYNRFNITLAQHLEKPLQEKGVFEAFKQRIAEEGGDWNDDSQAADLIDNELDWVLEIAKDLAPSLSIDSIRERIIKRDTVLSIQRFGSELAAYLKTKGENYRLIMLADEVSQFINKERDRYLNLQEIITHLSEVCDNKVWIACTAQQDLSEIMEDCHIDDERDKEGKIKGRFEVKVSLKGTQPEVITQKRILDKKEEVKYDLATFYEKSRAAFDLQFKLPNSFSSYSTEQDFIDYYPFVPYQFKLIKQVFDSFKTLSYVAQEVKGNERSIIKVVHATAKSPVNTEAELGKFVSFDELYNSMFEEGLQTSGQRAVDNAIRMARTYERDPKFAVRVANVLFMICNISKTDQLLFPATVDNVTTLLVNDITTPRLNIKNEVEKVVDYLCENNVIRREQSKTSAPDTFTFYSEEEMKMAKQIQNSAPQNDTKADILKDIFFKHLNVRNKEQYLTRNFAVGATIKQRNFLSNNADVVVEFVMDEDYDTIDMLAMHNASNRLLFYLAPQFKENKRLQNAYYSYCKTLQYLKDNPEDKDDANTRKTFKKRAEELYELVIAPEFHKILDTCPIVSGQSVMDDTEFASKKGSERYQTVVQKHLANIYNKATLVNRAEMPHTTEALKKAILRPVNPGDYTGFNAALPDAESEVERYLNNQFIEVKVSEVLAKFGKAPFGWDTVCTLYVINELVRRHNRDYSYANNPNVETSLVANRIVSETNKFTLRKGKSISQQVITDFTNAWKEIFGMADSFGTTDSTQIFRLCREAESARSLVRLRDNYKAVEARIAAYPFVPPIRQAIDLMDAWLAERDPAKFFHAVIHKKAEARELFDRCKEVIQFTHDQLDTYRMLLSFVEDNAYNFPFVATEQQTKVDELLKIKTDAWPVQGLRSYIRLQRELSAALDRVREDLRQKVRRAYEEIYVYLEKVAKEYKFTLPERDAIITQKTASTHILVLRDNANTDTFYQEQIDRIMKAKPGDGGGDTPPTERINKASLDTKTKLPLKNEEDINRYLSGLREQLMKKLVNYDGVMIIK